MDEAGTRNRIDGSVAGAVVQAGTIHQVVLNPQPHKTVLPQPRQLPAAVRDFAGRHSELAALDRFLPPDQEHYRGGSVVITVDGTAGVGKTSLALWWAHRVEHRFPDGTLFADLRGHGPSAPVDARLVLASFLHALGVPEDQVPADSDTQKALYRSLLAALSVLVVLDNAASAEQVRSLLPATKGCAAVVTSRGILTGLVVTESARRLPLDLLTPLDAVGLVTQVIGQDRADAEPGAVAELVALCARLPLAVRVASSRVAARPHTSVTDVVDDLTDEQNGLDTLSTTGDDRSAVRTVFDWSYTRLSPEHARTFRRLGLHPGTEFSVPALAALTGLDQAQALRQVEVLADLHLVEPVARRRYRLHDLLHAYAAHRSHLDDTDTERHNAVTAVLGWYARTAAAADRLVFPANPSPTIDLDEVSGPPLLADRDHALAWLTLEHATLQTALRLAGETGAHREAMAIALAMRFLVVLPRALWPARVQAESRGLDAARACGDRRMEAMFLSRMGDTHAQLGDWTESDDHQYAALALAEDLGDTLLRAITLTGLGYTRVLQQRFADAEPLLQQALPLARQAHSDHLEAVVYTNLAHIAVRLGRPREALEHAHHELDVRREIGAAPGIAYALHAVASARQQLGEHSAAIHLCDEALSLYRTQTGSEPDMAATLETQATSLLHLDDREAAVRCLTEAVSLLTDLGDPHAQTLRGRLRLAEQPPADPHPG